MGMHIEALKLVMAQRDLGMADIARMAGVSRQAVFLWLAQDKENPIINIQTVTLVRLAKALNLKIEQLMNVPLTISNEKKREELRARFIWDRMYPNLEGFLCACSRGEPRALARLIESYGLFGSVRIAGKGVWKKFDRLKKLLHPVLRKECEILWNLQKNLSLI